MSPKGEWLVKLWYIHIKEYYPAIKTNTHSNLYGSQGAYTELKSLSRELPSGPVARTRRFHCQSLGSIPGRGTKILQARKEKLSQRPILKALICLSLSFNNAYIGSQGVVQLRYVHVIVVNECCMIPLT